MEWLAHLADQADELGRWQPPIKWRPFENWAKGVRPFFVERLGSHLEEFDKLTARPNAQMLPRSAPMRPSSRLERVFGTSDMDRYRRDKARFDARSRRASALQNKWFQEEMEHAWRNTVAFVDGILRAKQDEPLFGPGTKEPEREVKHVFLGHGRSDAWEQMASFLHHGLGLEIEEFNRGESPAGKTNSEHVEDLLSRSHFAFLLFTGEDEQPDGTKRARENVVDETGRCQTKLGRRKAIVIQEIGCTLPSNLDGLIPIRFPAGKIHAISEQVRGVLQREGML